MGRGNSNPWPPTHRYGPFHPCPPSAGLLHRAQGQQQQKHLLGAGEKCSAQPRSRTLHRAQWSLSCCSQAPGNSFKCYLPKDGVSKHKRQREAAGRRQKVPTQHCWGPDGEREQAAGALGHAVDQVLSSRVLHPRGPVP